MKLVDDFFNKACGDLGKIYFPNVTYYRDDKDFAKVTYAMELFSNGCLRYGVLVTRLAKHCKTDANSIEQILNKYIIDYGN